MRHLLVFNFVFIFSVAQAQTFSAGVSTEFPIGVNLEGSIDLPNQPIYGKARYGLFLGPYADAMNSVAEKMDFYNSATSDIIAEALHNAQFWELAVGWSPAREQGFYSELSYFSVSGQGEVTGATIAAAVANITLPGGTNMYDIRGQIDALGLRVGYKFPFTEKSLLTTSFGVLKPIDSKTEIDRDVSGPVQQQLLADANRELDDYINDIMVNDVYIPIFSIGWTYLF